MSQSSSLRLTAVTGKSRLPAGYELLLFSSARPNLLLEGQASRVAAVVAVLTPHLPPPVTTWLGGPLPGDHRGTLIVEGVDRLHAVQQEQLIRWLDHPIGRVQVIATASGRLFSLVERRAFSDTLYYRLNIVRIEVPA